MGVSIDPDVFQEKLFKSIEFEWEFDSVGYLLFVVNMIKSNSILIWGGGYYGYSMSKNKTSVENFDWNG